MNYQILNYEGFRKGRTVHSLFISRNDARVRVAFIYLIMNVFTGCSGVFPLFSGIPILKIC